MSKLNKIPLGISSCLLGEQVRYDGGHKQNSYILGTLGDYFEFIPFCPEVAIGLGIPRDPIRLVRQGGEIRCVGVKDPSLDVTDALARSADRQRAIHNQLCGYILKKDSPSCGMERVKLFNGAIPQRKGVGIFAARLSQNHPNLPLEEEGRLGDPVLRENFIQRVFIYRRWQELLAGDLSWSALNDFHARHKLILMSHDQSAARELGRLLAKSGTKDVAEFAGVYITQLMAILKTKASRKNHVNVLQHIQGYLKTYLDKADKQELSETIEQYRLGRLPLIVPVTLLRHHFRRHPDTYIERSWYLYPHPAELMLLNDL